MIPPVGLTGTEANPLVRSYAKVRGPTVDSIGSLHGPGEAMEDLAAMAIPDGFRYDVYSCQAQRRKS